MPEFAWGRSGWPGFRRSGPWEAANRADYLLFVHEALVVKVRDEKSHANPCLRSISSWHSSGALPWVVCWDGAVLAAGISQDLVALDSLLNGSWHRTKGVRPLWRHNEGLNAGPPSENGFSELGFA